MTAAAETKSDKPGWREGIAVYLKPRVLIVLFLGFSAGLPLALSGSTLLVWMREVGVDLGDRKPQKLTDDLARGAQMLITMG